MSAELARDGGVLRRLVLCVAIGAAGATAVAGASVVVHGKLRHIPAQPPRQAVATKAVAPPPIALQLVLQATPPVPSIDERPATSTKPTTTHTTKKTRGGKAKVKHQRRTPGGTRTSSKRPAG